MSKIGHVDCAGVELRRGDIIKIEHEDHHFIYAMYSGENNMLILRTPDGSYSDTIENVTKEGKFFKDNSDDDYLPLPPDVIIARAKELPLAKSDDGGKMFFTLCRYAAQTVKQIPSAQGHNVPTQRFNAPAQGYNTPTQGYMAPAQGYNSYQKITDSHGKELSPGDVIVFESGEFKHWAIYVGEGNVVHFTVGGVKKENIHVVAKGFTFSIDKSLKSRSPAHMVVISCNARVGPTRPYDPQNYNCESFVNEIMCIIPKSKQAEKFQKKNGPKMPSFSLKKSSSASSSVDVNGHMHTHVTGSGMAVAQSGGKVQISGPQGSTFQGYVLQNGQIPAPLFCAICQNSSDLKQKL